MKHSLMTLLAASLAFAAVVEAEVPPQLRPVVVLRSEELPTAAQGTSESGKLYELPSGETYLYIEQEQMGRLVILDVTDPAHIKTVGIAQMDLPEAFDFGKFPQWKRLGGGRYARPQAACSSQHPGSAGE